MLDALLVVEQSAEAAGVAEVGRRGGGRVGRRRAALGPALAPRAARLQVLCRQNRVSGQSGSDRGRPRNVSVGQKLRRRGGSGYSSLLQARLCKVARCETAGSPPGQPDGASCNGGIQL